MATATWGYGWKILNVETMASGQTFSTIISIPEGYSRVYLEIPTFASGADVYVNASTDGTTFRPVCNEVTAVALAVPARFGIKSTVSQTIVKIPGPFPYYQVEISTFVTDTVTNFNLICMRGN